MGGLFNPTSEKYENLIYFVPVRTSNDLEAATKTITATAEAAGVGNKDYSAALTLAIPTDSRLAIKRVGTRLAVTIDSMTATHLYCKVYVDAQDADHLLFSEDFTTTGAKLDAVDVLVGTKEIIFNLLKDGAAHTFYFFFWVDAGNAVLSVVQAWEGIGSCSLVPVAVMALTHVGTFSLVGSVQKVGTGTNVHKVANPINPYYENQTIVDGTRYLLMSASYVNLTAAGSVTTDLNYYSLVAATLKSVQ